MVEHPGLSMSVLHTNTNGYKRDHRRVNQLEGFNSVMTSVWMGRAYNGVGHQQARALSARLDSSHHRGGLRPAHRLQLDWAAGHHVVDPPSQVT